MDESPCGGRVIDSWPSREGMAEEGRLISRGKRRQKWEWANTVNKDKALYGEKVTRSGNWGGPRRVREIGDSTSGARCSNVPRMAAFIRHQTA